MGHVFSSLPQSPQLSTVLDWVASQMYDTSLDLKAGLHPCAITECHHSVVPMNTAPPEGHRAAIHADYVDHASLRYVTCNHWLKAGGFRCPGLDIILPKAYLARYPPKVLRDSLAWCTDLTINPDREIKRFPWLTLVDLNHTISCFLGKEYSRQGYLDGK